MKRTGLQRWLILIFIMAAASEVLASRPQDAQDAGAYQGDGHHHIQLRPLINPLYA